MGKKWHKRKRTGRGAPETEALQKKGEAKKVLKQKHNLKMTGKGISEAEA